MSKLNISRPVEALISLLSLCLYTARIFPRLENPQLWAEDGSIFLETAFESDLPFSLLVPYQGYFHLIPMSVAEFSTLFSLEVIPIIFAASNLVMIAILYMLIFCLIEREEIRIASYVMIPLAFGANEIYGNITNFHWFFAILALGIVSQKITLSKTPLYLALLLTGPFFVMAIAAKAALRAMEMVQRQTDLQIRILIGVVFYLTFHNNLHVIFDIMITGIGSMAFFSTHAQLSLLIAFCAIGLVLVFWAYFEEWEKNLLYFFLLYWISIGYKSGFKAIGQPLMDGWGGRYFFLPEIIVLILLISTFLKITATRRLVLPALILTSIGLLYANTTNSPIFEFQRSYQDTWLRDVQEYYDTGDRTLDIQPNWKVTLSDKAVCTVDPDNCPSGF